VWRGLAVIVRIGLFFCGVDAVARRAAGDRRGRQTEGAMGAGLQVWLDGQTKTNVAQKNVHALFFLVVGDIEIEIVADRELRMDWWCT